MVQIIEAVNYYEVYAAADWDLIYAVYKGVDSVYALGKLDKVKIDLVFVHVVDIQATIMQVEDSDVKMVVEINELQLVAISFDLDTTVGTNEKVAP